MSAFGGKADIARTLPNVRYCPKADIVQPHALPLSEYSYGLVRCPVLSRRAAMRRRDFIKSVSGGAGAWPLAGRAQQPKQPRRIGVLMNRAADNALGHAQLAVFQRSLQELGLSDGGNVRIDVRWGANIGDLERKYAAELVALAPEVILASGTQSVAALQR